MPYFNSVGGETVTFTGQNFGTVQADATIQLDGLACTLTTLSATSIVCTNARQLPSQIPEVKSFVFKIGNQIGAVLQAPIYVYRWSNDQTWGGDVPPVDGDLVQIPNGLVLLIDQNVPQLAGIYSN